MLRLFSHLQGDHKNCRNCGKASTSVMKRPVTATMTPTNVKISSLVQDTVAESNVDEELVSICVLDVGAAWIGMIVALRTRLR